MKREFLWVVLTAFLLVMSGCGSGGSDELLESDDAATSTDSGSTSSDSSVGDLGALVDLGDLVDDGDNWYHTVANAINDDGTIVGESNFGSYYKFAFSWDSATEEMTELGIHGGTYTDYLDLTDDVEDDPFIYSEAVDINSSGEIIGNSTTGSDDELRAFYWTDAGGFADISPPAYWDSDGNRKVGSFSQAVDINDAGEVVLTVEDEDGTYAYYWDGETYEDNTFTSDSSGNVTETVPYLVVLGVVYGEQSEAVAINEIGHTVVNSGGNAVFSDVENNVVTVTEVLNGLESTDATAVDINNIVNSGTNMSHIVGNSGDYGFFWDGGSMVSVGSLGGGTSNVVDFNDDDQVVGDSTTSDGYSHAFLWSLDDSYNGSMIDLGTLGGNNSYATAINEAGQVVGYSETGDTYSVGEVESSIYHAFLWDDGTMYDLGTHDDFYDFDFDTSYPFSSAVGVNSSGQVAGNSTTINSISRGFFIDPSSL
jgi:probable HAF family extracellular repeat protein